MPALMMVLQESGALRLHNRRVLGEPRQPTVQGEFPEK